MDASEEFIDNVLKKMEKHLDKEQISILERVLSIDIRGWKIVPRKYEVIPHDDTAERILCRFLTTKRKH